MNTKYQIFVSSTFTDLIDERTEIQKSILDLGHIPAGMELFPAADQDQFDYIKKVIDECDYYLIILAARYGSTTADGISYTELEYRYAESRGLPILAFVHADIETVPLGKADIDPTARDRLTKFREALTKGRLVQFWKDKMDLKAKAIVSMSKAFSESPQIGWTRSNQVASTDALEDIVRYQRQVEDLKSRIAELEAQTPQPDTKKLAGFETVYNFRFKKKRRTPRGSIEYNPTSIDISLGDFFIAIAHTFMTGHTASSAGTPLGKYLDSSRRMKGEFAFFNENDLLAAILQLVGLGFLKMYTALSVQKTRLTYFELTSAGQARWLQLSLQTK